jgi:hypothetical protein
MYRYQPDAPTPDVPTPGPPLPPSPNGGPERAMGLKTFCQIRDEMAMQVRRDRGFTSHLGVRVG